MRKSDARRTVKAIKRASRLASIRAKVGLENIKIGKFGVEGLAHSPAGDVVIPDHASGGDRILHVSAKANATEFKGANVNG